LANGLNVEHFGKQIKATLNKSTTLLAAALHANEATKPVGMSARAMDAQRLCEAKIGPESVQFCSSEAVSGDHAQRLGEIRCLFSVALRSVQETPPQ